jgi:hypothetical protein
MRGQSDQGVAYMMGGIGSDEREKMSSLAGDYNLKLAFAEKAGVYLAGVKVAIQEQNGRQLVNMTTNGPWVYLRLPPGNYKVEATFEGKTQTLDNVRLAGQRRAERVLRWDLPQEFPLYAEMKRAEAQDRQHTGSRAPESLTR